MESKTTLSTASDEKKEPVFIPEEILKQTLKPEGYEKNVFIQNLLRHVLYSFKAKDVEKVISQYYLGTVTEGYRIGAITFPFIDKEGHVRTIQVKQFDETNHTTGTDFLHSIHEKNYQQRKETLPSWLEEYKNNDLKVSCLFGEHLLRKYPNNPIALVEAPKTAIYGTLYFGFPDQNENLLWLAVYNLSSLNKEKCRVLQGRDVFLFPDLSEDGKAFDLWSRKARDISYQLPGSHFEVSNLLETLAPNDLRMQGADIGDVLIKLDWRKFRPNCLAQLKIESNPLVKSESSEKRDDVKTNSFLNPKESNIIEKCQLQGKVPRPLWQIKQSEQFFAKAILLTQPIKLDPCCQIIDVCDFMDSHLSIVNAQNENPCYPPYLFRLAHLKKTLNINSN